MLNISENSIAERIKLEHYPSLHQSGTRKEIQYFKYWLYTGGFFILLILFLPWTQVVSGTGSITAIDQGQRPQTVQSPIPGRIEEWFVQEGDTVQTGDTLARLSEIKEEYFDEGIEDRAREELQAKNDAVLAYRNKAESLGQQVEQLERSLVFKKQQLEQEIDARRIAVSAASTNRELARLQFMRVDTLFNEGIESRLNWEKRKQYAQETEAKWVKAQNDYQKALIDRSGIEAEYREKIAKAQSDLFSARSAGLEAEGEVAKLRVKLGNLSMRRGYYWLRAPRSGVITRSRITGLGENISAGESILEIVATAPKLGVEIFVRPVDLPLIKRGQHARIEFDGWPTIVFSGWPNTSFGTFGAQVVAVDQSLDENGRYRVLLQPDPTDIPWPEPLRFGSGARGMLLLNEVPVWFEIWRQLNGFPPEYYTGTEKEEKIKTKPKAGYQK
ncbi:HlyD family efflux transporter periplasmic adaptor subunit [bacterium]|nr:HlyD family efflux transporter periplasmic adaptor subunit [bacterium]